MSPLGNLHTPTFSLSLSCGSFSSTVAAAPSLGCKGEQSSRDESQMSWRDSALPVPLSGEAAGATQKHPGANPSSGNISTCGPPFGSDVVACLKRASQALPPPVCPALVPHASGLHLNVTFLPLCFSYRCLFFAVLAFPPISLRVNRHGKGAVYYLLSGWRDSRRLSLLLSIHALPLYQRRRLYAFC